MQPLPLAATAHWHESSMAASNSRFLIAVVLLESLECLFNVGYDILGIPAMLEKFLFTADQQYSPIGKLSGGEKRRLYLCKILMEALDSYGSCHDMVSCWMFPDVRSHTATHLAFRNWPCQSRSAHDLHLIGRCTGQSPSVTQRGACAFSDLHPQPNGLMMDSQRVCTQTIYGSSLVSACRRGSIPE